MLKFSTFLTEDFDDDIHNERPIEDDTQAKLFCENDYLPIRTVHNLMAGFILPGESYIVESVEDHPDNDKRLVFKGSGRGTDANGLVVPRHMWEGGKTAIGMQKRNELRAKVYGGENRDPLTLGEMAKIHKQTLKDHFAKPKSEQIAAEKAAVARLKAAGHLARNGDTTDKGEKTDTVNHEYDEQGRSFVAAASKGVAGHALYTSGSGENEKHHVLNTCPAQTAGCGGGVDANGIADTSKGTCFAPKAESQYADASIKRACHEQAKHDPAMTRDWILAHNHSIRRRADAADKKNKRLLIRPNVVDESDLESSKSSVQGLNDQRATEANPKRPGESKPPIIANSYGKTNELHDPENNYFVTHSNIGPKTKAGRSISENIRRDDQRVRSTINATQGASGKDNVNAQGHKTPPKGSYMVTDMRRGSDLDKAYQSNISHVKYWSKPREEHELSSSENAEGSEGHYDGNGKATTPDKAHYGHKTINGRRYDYQKQHVLHPRLVKSGDHEIPTDSRFKDEDFLPKERFKSKSGKTPGGILVTTPTLSTSIEQHRSSFTHHVGPETIEHAKMNNGEHEVDKPEDQEAARGKEYVAPEITSTKDKALNKAKAKAQNMRQKIGRPMTGIEREIARTQGQQTD